MSTLADAITRDILKDRPQSTQAPTCFVCGRSYGKGDGRFCSALCRAAYDDGFPSCEAIGSPSPYDLPPRADGFVIECAGCRKPFVSGGLRSCSAECERTYRERQEIAAIVAEVGGDLPAKRKCEQCGGDIPRYRGVGKARRQVSKATRFCSDKCGAKARKQSSGSTPALSPGSAQKSLSPNGSRSTPNNPSPAAEGIPEPTP